MIKIACLILVVLLSMLSPVVLGQSADAAKTENEIIALLTHKWFFDSIQIKETKLSAKSYGEENAFIHFHSNNTFSEASKLSTGLPINEQWHYNHKTKTITINGGSMKILSITESKFVCATLMDGQKVIAFFKRNK